MTLLFTAKMQIDSIKVPEEVYKAIPPIGHGIYKLIEIKVRITVSSAKCSKHNKNNELIHDFTKLCDHITKSPLDLANILLGVQVVKPNGYSITKSGFTLLKKAKDIDKQTKLHIGIGAYITLTVGIAHYLDFTYKQPLSSLRDYTFNVHYFKNLIESLGLKNYCCLTDTDVTNVAIEIYARDSKNISKLFILEPF